MYEQGEIIDAKSAGPLYEDETGVSLHELLKGIKDEIQKRYPNSTFTYFASDKMPEQIPGKVIRYNSFGEYGDKTLNDIAGTDLAQHEDRAYCFCRNVFLNVAANWERKDCKNQEMITLHNAVIDFARTLGLDTQGLSKFSEKKDEKPKFIHTMGQKMAFDGNLEAHISEVQKELDRLIAMRNPQNLIPQMKAEEKRLRKSGDFKAAEAKKQEIETLEAAARKIADDAKHQEEKRKKNLESLGKARAALRAKREMLEEEKRKAAEKQARAEADRNRHQFQPCQAAKARLQKMKQDKAERAARKKKGQEGRDYNNIRSCSPMLTKV